MSSSSLLRMSWWGCLLLSPMCLISQELPQSYGGSSFPAFAREVKTQMGIPLFYIPEWVDSLTVQQAAGVSSLADVLDATLQPVGLGWWRSPSGAIYLLPAATRLQSSLPPPPRHIPTQNRPQAGEASDIALVDHQYDPARRGPIRMPPRTLGLDNGQTRATLSGYVKDEASGSAIAGASVQVEALRIGAYTDETGYFALSMPTGSYELRFRSFGKGEIIQPLILRGDAELNMEMRDAIKELDEVLIEAERQRNVEDVQMGVSQLSIQAMKQMPALMGEVDVIKSALLLPGVQTVGEGSGGFNVRGGAVDQNLILLQDAPVFNPNHLFGFFSAFNPDVISEFELYKSGIPAKYGGRISSVFDIRMKEGNRRKYEVRGGNQSCHGATECRRPDRPGQRFLCRGWAQHLLGLDPETATRSGAAQQPRRLL